MAEGFLEQIQKDENWQKVALGSPYAWAFLQKNPELWQRIAEAPDAPFLPLPLLEAGVTESAVMKHLRVARHIETARIIYNEFNRRVSLQESVEAISNMADQLTAYALDAAERLLPASLGKPFDQHGNPMQLVVLGMGKLGGRELNLSSDIDLIFCFPEKGETQGGRSGIDHQTYFTRLAQVLIRLLDANTVDGQVFRVDMRLRPWGESGPLVQSFNAMELYYQAHGRDWERYAMIKVRPISGDLEAGNALLKTLRPFVFRRYIDFSVISSLREMKAMIELQVKKLGKVQDVKLGAGGIREIEFICQVHQLIHGGRDPGLQPASLFSCYKRLLKRGLLTREEVEGLLNAYVFLRFTEHALQAHRNEQTQRLPETPEDQIRLAKVMGFEDWAGFEARLNQHRSVVIQAFADLIAPTGEEASAPVDDCLALWQSGELEVDDCRALGTELSPETMEPLRRLQASSGYKALQPVSRERVDQFMAKVIARLGDFADPSRVVEGIVTLVTSVKRRTAYLVMLMEQPPALERLMQLYDASPWIAKQMANYPVHLDEFLTDGHLEVPQSLEHINDEWAFITEHYDLTDTEVFLERLSVLYRSITVRVIIAEVEGDLPVMKVSDALTWLAEVVLQQVFDHVWQKMKEQYGVLRQKDGSEVGMLIVGFGKLGGIELGHTSDLDIVCIHDGDVSIYSDGERQLDVASYTSRVVQRIISLLSNTGVGGKLYELDLRLRPDGNNGPLVSPFSAVQKYYQDQAWTWEHQALVRARPVVGALETLGKAFADMRCQILRQARDVEALTKEVLDMRAKMRKHLAGEQASTLPTDWQFRSDFALKQDRGGIVDIEFLVQYLVLKHAHQHPELPYWTDNIRILDTVAAVGLMAKENVISLQQAYQLYRQETHRLGLQSSTPVAEADKFAATRQQVIDLWQASFNE